MTRHELELFADYFHFYVQDEPVDSDLSRAWDDESVARLLAVAPGVVGIGTVRNMSVPVTIELISSEPAADFEESDHVVECSLSVRSGRIAVAGCTDYFPEAKRIDVPSGMYRVRVSYFSLASLSNNDLSGNDHYLLQLWQGQAIDPLVLKHRGI